MEAFLRYCLLRFEIYERHFVKEIDVFLDLEQVGVGASFVGSGRRLQTLLREMPAFLEAEGYAIGKIWGTACLCRGTFNLPVKLQTDIKGVVARYGGTVVWTTENADKALMKEVRTRLANSSLAPAVLFVTGDRHFAPLVQELRAAGREVVVSCYAISKVLSRAADKRIDLWKVIGQEEAFVAVEPLTPFNAIPLP